MARPLFGALVALITALGSGVLVLVAAAPVHAVADKDCGDFASQRAAQIFFIKHGGPQSDPHGLDGNDHDGRACESRPDPHYYGTHLPGGGSTAPTKVKTTVHLAVPRTSGIAGERLRFRIDVDPAIKRRVVLQRRAGSHWKRVTEVRTSARGKAVETGRVRSATTAYRAVAHKLTRKKIYLADSSPTRKLRTLRQSGRLSMDNRVERGSKARARAVFSPVRRGREVVLQQRRAGVGWVEVTSAEENRKGAVRFRVRLQQVDDYRFRAVAVERHGAAEVSSNREEVRVRDTTPPPAPRRVLAVGRDGAVRLSWRGVSVDDLRHYRVYQSSSRTGRWTRVGSTPRTHYQVTGLTNGTTYWFVVRAVDASGNKSPRSDSVSATPAGDPVDTTPPPTPASLSATPGDAVVHLSWAEVTAPDLDHYRVYVGTAPADLHPSDAVAAGATECDVAALADGTALSNGTEYWFAISAVDEIGNESDLTDPVGGTPEPPTG